MEWEEKLAAFEAEFVKQSEELAESFEAMKRLPPSFDISADALKELDEACEVIEPFLRPVQALDYLGAMRA